MLSAINSVFEEFRSQFFGRSGVQFWWGGFDLTVLLFNGRATPAPAGSGYIMRYDLDAEHLNAGFWAGDDERPGARPLRLRGAASPGLRGGADGARLRRLGRGHGRVDDAL